MADKEIIVVNELQSIFNLALQYYGAVEGVQILLEDNLTLIDLNAPIPAGTKLVYYPSKILNKDVVKYFAEKGRAAASSGGKIKAEIITSLTDLAFPDTTSGGTSAAQSFKIYGRGLTNPIVLTAPSGFIIYIGSTTTNQSPITLTPVNGEVDSVIVNVRFKPSIVQTYSANITCVSSGASSVNVQAEGNSI